MDSEAFEQLCYYISRKYQIHLDLTKNIVYDINKFKPILKETENKCIHTIYSNTGGNGNKNIIFCVNCKQNWHCNICSKIVYYENIYSFCNRKEKIITCKNCNKHIKTDVCKYCEEYNCNSTCIIEN